MEYLEHIFKNKIRDLNKIEWFSEKIKKMTLAIIQCIIDNNWKIASVEKHVMGMGWHGHIDLVVRDDQSNYMIIEIKTRGNLDVKPQDKMQVLLYTHIIGAKKCGVLVVNRKTFEYKFEQVSWRKNHHIITKLNNWLEILGLNEYRL